VKLVASQYILAETDSKGDATPMFFDHVSRISSFRIYGGSRVHLYCLVNGQKYYASYTKFLEKRPIHHTVNDIKDRTIYFHPLARELDIHAISFKLHPHKLLTAEESHSDFGHVITTDDQVMLIGYHPLRGLHGRNIGIAAGEMSEDHNILSKFMCVPV